MPHIQFITVVTRSHLQRARCLAESLRQHEPNARLCVYLVERTQLDADNPDGAVDMVPLAALKLPDFWHFCFRYNTKELATAVRPYALLHALATSSATQFVYLDSDTDLLAPLSESVAQWLTTHAVLLTPHRLHPALPMGKTEHDILKAGIYNTGFVAFTASDSARAVLQWWADRLEYWSIEDPMGGILYDQRWLDPAVALFAQIGIVRHPGLNLGFWSMDEREIAWRWDTWWVRLLGARDWQPLLLMHFSGISATRISVFLEPVQEQSAQIQSYAGLAADYRLRLDRQALPSVAAPSFEHFDDGQPILPAMRELVRLNRVATGNPFAERATIAAATPADVDALFWGRPTHVFNWACTWKPMVDELLRRGVIRLQHPGT